MSNGGQPDTDEAYSTDGYVDWLLDARAKIIAMVSANPSLAVKAISVPPLSDLAAETLARAHDLIDHGDPVELVDLLITAVRDEAIRSMMRPDTTATD